MDEGADIDTRAMSRFNVGDQVALNSLVANFSNNGLFGDVCNVCVMSNINGMNLLSLVIKDIV